MTKLAPADRHYEEFTFTKCSCRAFLKMASIFPDLPVKTRLASIVCLALLSFTFSAEAKKRPAPTATPDPAGQAPSARLSTFMRMQLDEVLAPLDKNGLKDARAITELRESFADGAARAPRAQRASYTTAEDVCQAMVNAYAGRQKSLSSLKGSRGVDADKKSQWEKRAALYRRQIEQLYARQRETERQVNPAISTEAAAMMTKAPGPAPGPIAPVPGPPPSIVGTLPPPQVVAPGSSPATPSIER
jgi:hypothetical protein